MNIHENIKGDVHRGEKCAYNVTLGTVEQCLHSVVVNPFTPVGLSGC